MNHLAHVFLAPDSPESRVGSILGDFSRGVQLASLPDKVQEGVRHHRAVDVFTDSHAAVLASKKLFSTQRRRFAGVALDVLYDHYLLKHWQTFSMTPRDDFVQEVYDDLQSNEHLMPPAMIRVTRHMVRHDWFGAYRNLDNIGDALDRVAERIRFPNQFGGIIVEIRDHHTELEKHFLSFFPELQSFARQG